MTVLPGLDPQVLTAWLDLVAPGLRAGPLVVSLMVGGKSNLTYRVHDGVHDWVLRRPPLGHVLPSAHDMGREFRVLTALHVAGYEVAEPILQATDSSILGAPFYLMAFVEGVALDRPQDIAALAPWQASRACRTLVHALGRLHGLDVVASGLAGFGRPDGFLSRQLVRWTQQWRASQVRPVPAVDGVIATLAAAIPTSARAAIVHGDYRLTNVLFDPDFSSVAAVVDWEMATLGDPLTDLGMLYAYHELAQHSGVIMPVLDPAGGFLSPAELLAEYAKATGTDLSAVGWYLAFGCFKVAAIAESIAARHRQGATVGDGFDRFVELAPLMIDRARGHLAAR